MLWAFLSLKSSPGATTTALAATAASGPEAALFVELDPAGGDLAARAQVAFAPPGLMALAAAGRRGVSDELVTEHARSIGPGLPVLLGPTDGTQAAAVVGSVAGVLAPALAARTGNVFADCGRWSPASPVNPILAAATATVVVLRPDPAEVDHVRCAVDDLQAVAANVVAAVVGRKPCSPSEVAEVLGVVVLGVVERDPRTSGALPRASRLGPVLRTPLVRSSATLLDALRQRSRQPSLVVGE